MTEVDRDVSHGKIRPDGLLGKVGITYNYSFLLGVCLLE